MKTPRTELDTRFSESAAQPTGWEDTLEAIKQAEIFWISTVRTDGRPHVTPLVAVWLDDALHFSTGPEEQKARNLASNPRVALTTGANDWQSGLDVVVEGEAARVTDAQQLHRLAAAWAQSGTGDGNTRSVRTAFDTASGPRSCSLSAQRKSLPSPRAASATPAIASEASTPHAGETIGGSTIVRGRTRAIHRAAGRVWATPVARHPVELSPGPGHRATRASAIRPTRRLSRRSSPDARRWQRSRRRAAAPLIIVLWRAGLRISEALALSESDLDRHRGAILVRRGKGGQRREVGVDRWAWEQLGPWLQLRATLPVGALFCVLRGPTPGRPWAPARVRAQLHHAAARAGVRRRFAPHQLRHAHAVELSPEGVPLLVIQRQLGHADLVITSVYLRGIDNTEIVHAVHERPAPMIPATHGL